MILCWLMWLFYVEPFSSFSLIGYFSSISCVQKNVSLVLMAKIVVVGTVQSSTYPKGLAYVQPLTKGSDKTVLKMLLT